MDAGSVLHVPECLSDHEAGGLMETTLTAYLNIFNVGGAKSGQMVLIHGGGSGVGTQVLAALAREAEQGQGEGRGGSGQLLHVLPLPLWLLPATRSGLGQSLLGVHPFLRCMRENQPCSRMMACVKGRPRCSRPGAESCVSGQAISLCKAKGIRTLVTAGRSARYSPP